ncbi:hypothetical protein VUR80DRAFT_3789 [Thermomyces stellatus]
MMWLGRGPCAQRNRRSNSTIVWTGTWVVRRAAGRDEDPRWIAGVNPVCKTWARTQGGSMETWQHGMPAERTSTGPRVRRVRRVLGRSGLPLPCSYMLVAPQLNPKSRLSNRTPMTFWFQPIIIPFPFASYKHSNRPANPSVPWARKVRLNKH